MLATGVEEAVETVGTSATATTRFFVQVLSVDLSSHKFGTTTRFFVQVLSADLSSHKFGA